MEVMYLVLFANFFYQSYVKGSSRPRKTKDE